MLRAGIFEPFGKVFNLVISRRYTDCPLSHFSQPRPRIFLDRRSKILALKVRSGGCGLFRYPLVSTLNSSEDKRLSIDGRWEGVLCY